MDAMDHPLLITRGDDFGSFEEANLAIIDSYQKGVMKCASIMAPAKHFEHAAQLARENPGLCVGLHLSLSSEWEEQAVRFGPVLGAKAVPSLVEPDGTFLASPMHHHRRGVKIDEMMRELKAQLAKARKAGVNIQYLDEHMGCAWVHPMPEGSKRLVDYVREWAREEGLLYYTDVHGDYAFHSRMKRRWTVEGAIAALDGLEKKPCLFMTHPAYNRGPLTRLVVHDDTPRPVPREGSDREDDARILQSPAFAKACADRGIRCVSYVEAAAAIGRTPERSSAAG
jgi:predicted glycoside hydrolase/deacetylase ChbG (UPF0249 family)